jgi:hypothetical protein
MEKGRVAAELAPTATLDAQPTAAYPCSSPPSVLDRPADALPPATPLSYIRFLMQCGPEFDHDQLVLELRRVPVGQMLSEAEADAVVTAAMASAGGDT